MAIWSMGAVGAALALASAPAMAQDNTGPSQPGAPEILAGVFEHGSNFHPLGGRLFSPRPPVGTIFEGEEENGTVDIQFGYRSAPLRFALKPRLTGKLQINTAGRTNFASLGAEWRQHVLNDRVYGQIGIGIAIHDGYRFTPDPFQPGLTPAEALRRAEIYVTRTSWGSRFQFNPNASLGVRLNHRWAVELAWEHFSHRQIFSEQNPGIDNLGLRLVRTLGPRRKPG